MRTVNQAINLVVCERGSYQGLDVLPLLRNGTPAAKPSRQAVVFLAHLLGDGFITGAIRVLAKSCECVHRSGSSL
jgi:hypothetical protein